MGAQNDTGGGTCTTGAEQTHVKCAAANADVQFGKLLDAVAASDTAHGGETEDQPTDGVARRLGN